MRNLERKRMGNRCETDREGGMEREERERDLTVVVN